MNCPSCKKESLCGCRSCKSRRKGAMPMQRSTGFGGKEDYIKCPYCRKKFHPDQILDSEYESRKNFTIENK